MYEFMLILHFIGLAMGLGTSLAFMFLGIAGSKMEKEEGVKFALNSFALSKMGHIGLSLLVISGIYLIIPHAAGLGSNPLLMVKLALVLLLAALIGIISSNAKKARQSEPEKYLKKIEPLGKLSLLTGLIIVILAVLIFH